MDLLYKLGFLLTTVLPPVTCPSGPRCKSSYKVAWLVYPPYLQLDNDTISGIIPSIIRGMVNNCCGKNVNLTYEFKLQSRSQAVEQILNATADFIFPISGSTEKGTFFSFPYIPIVESPGVALFTRAPDSPTDAIFRAVKTTWPLFVIIFLLVAINGALFWLLEFKFNRKVPKEQPIKGAAVTEGLFEGMWWAIVTMTTVGYGDVYARSNAGRILTVAWLLLGVVACAIFTGIVTATLTSICLSSDVELRGSKVAVLTDSEEYKLAVSRNAVPIGVDSIRQSLRELEREQADAMLIDSFIAGANQELLRDYRLQTVIEKYFGYGIVLGVHTVKHAVCLRNYVMSQQNAVYKAIATFARPLKRGRSTAVEKSRGMIDITDKGFYLPMVVTVTLLVILCLVGHNREKTLCRTGNTNEAQLPYRYDHTLASLKHNHGSELKRMLTHILSETTDIRDKCSTLILRVEDRISPLSRSVQEVELTFD